MFVLPDRVLAWLPEGARVVEVGVGGRFDLLASIARRRPDVELAATDVHASAVEAAPSGVDAVVDDVTAPDASVYQNADLLVAVRCPAELQPPLARLARDVGAGLALHAFKDEWANVDRLLGRHELVSTSSGAWRVWGLGSLV